MPRRALVLGLVFLVAGTSLSAVVACRNGDDKDVPTPTETAGNDEEFVRVVCVGLTEWKASFDETWTPGMDLTPGDMVPLFDAFLVKLESTKAVELEDFRTAWIDRTRDNVEKIQRGESAPAWDPMETLPATAEDDDARLEELTNRIPECVELFGEPTPEPDRTPTTPAISFPIAHSVDYAKPENYLVPGPQSTFTAENAQLVRSEIGEVTNDLEGVGTVYRWMSRTFRSEPTGGADIGRTDVNGMLASRRLTGCHDGALMMSAVLRLTRFPAVMVDAADIQWAKDFAAGTAQGYVGHAMAEVYVGGQWMLVDCGSGRFVRAYDPALSVIAPGSSPGMDPGGFYVIFKGTDPAAYGVTGGEALRERMEAFSQALGGLTIESTAYSWEALP